jgi:hypothetical protein
VGRSIGATTGSGPTGAAEAESAGAGRPEARLGTMAPGSRDVSADTRGLDAGDPGQLARGTNVIPEGGQGQQTRAPGRIRTCVEGIRSPSPDPLGHGGSTRLSARSPAGTSEARKSSVKPNGGTSTNPVEDWRPEPSLGSLLRCGVRTRAPGLFVHEVEECGRSQLPVVEESTCARRRRLPGPLPRILGPRRLDDPGPLDQGVHLI